MDISPLLTETLGWPGPVTLLFILWLALTPSWFFLLGAYRHCKKYGLPAAPWLGRVALWPGWGLGLLYSTVPVKSEEQQQAIYKRFFWTGSILSITYLACGVALLVI